MNEIINTKKDFILQDKTVIIKSEGKSFYSPDSLLHSKLFKTIMEDYVEHLKKNDSPLLSVFGGNVDLKELHKVLDLLLHYPKDSIMEMNPYSKHFFDDSFMFLQFIENLYNFWRSHERYFIIYSNNFLRIRHHERPYRTFNNTVEKLNDFVRIMYRDLCENITAEHPRIYRQVTAGIQAGIISAYLPEAVPEDYAFLKNIPFINQILLEPPLILDPPMNTRTGMFKKVETNPIIDLSLNEEEWICYPAKVGPLVIYVYFNFKFIGLGTSLANLFEIAEEEDFAKKPDAIYLYGVDTELLKDYDSKTIFHYDEKNDLYVGAVPNGNQFGYFGYIKKMILTLHNSRCIQKGMMPIHGAMVKISLKNGKNANVIIVGDSGAGKSESLEAFRLLGSDYLRDMRIIFDDMGSLKLDENGEIIAYGTETGAFVRLDDLQPGFAFGNLDRAIIHSPQKINARAILPITTLKEITEGTKIDYFIYANNYSEIKNDKKMLREFKDKETAFEVFKKGKRMAKGTTSEKGLTESYFANPFGAPQHEAEHEKIAHRFFDAMYSKSIYVGEIKTRLGLIGFESTGPEEAAKDLFEHINNCK